MSMRGQEFKVRDKKVQKMTRDGLTEKNLTQGTEQRISGRTAEKTAVVGRSQGHVRGNVQSRMGKKQPQEPPQTQPEDMRGSKDAAVPEVWGSFNAPAPMRETTDSPMFSAQIPPAGSTAVGYDAAGYRTDVQDVLHTSSTGQQKDINRMDNRRNGRNTEKTGRERKSRTVAERKLYEQPPPGAEKIDPGEVLVGGAAADINDTGGRLRSVHEDMAVGSTKDQWTDKKGMAVRSSTDVTRSESRIQLGSGRLRPGYVERADKPEKARSSTDAVGPEDQIRSGSAWSRSRSRKGSDELTKERRTVEKEMSVRTIADPAKAKNGIREEVDLSGPGRSQSGCMEKAEGPSQDRQVFKKRMAMRSATNTARPGSEMQKGLPVSLGSGQLRSEHEENKADGSLDRTVDKKKPGMRSSSDDAEPKREARLHYIGNGLPPGGCKDAAPQQRMRVERPAGDPRQQKRYEKAHRRLGVAEKKLEAAQSKLPTRRRAYLQKQYDSRSGKVKRRLRFETEIIPEYERPSLPRRAGRSLVRTARTSAVLKAHQKVRETERDNVGVEAAHKGGSAAERAAGRFLRWNKRRIHERPYREVRRAEKRLARANAEMAYQKLLTDSPELRKRSFSRWLQKQRLKRRYAVAARETTKGAEHATNVLTATGQVIRAMVRKAAAHKTILGIVALAVLILAVFSGLFSSCSAMLTGVQSAVLSTCYVAEDTEIERSELRYTELETDLQIDINRTEQDHPNYDGYRYDVGEIGHDPYELMGYLSARYGDFTYAQIETELDRLFGEQYQLTREEIIETRTYLDADGQEQEYDWYVLKTTLTVRPLSEIIAAGLAASDQMERYGVYMQTCGNRQCYGDPFDFPWIAYVTSPYGYRVHPSTGVKDLHRGIDIAVAAGTPIRAIQDGRVISAGNAGGYGLCVVIEGEDGYQSRYAHCSSISVRAGQEVRQGDIIASVGSTGDSIGTYLHLEVTHNGQYLNPYYYVDNGGSGYLPGGGAVRRSDLAADPRAAMSDGDLAAMLTEAERYLGFPYVWGGSSPSTSFDCSGFVSWVIDRSGVGNVGRQTAQGLYDLCIPVSREDMQPGDLVFFTGTYSAATPVTHVGIYVGGGRMIHCGDPISYVSIDGDYWSSHFYSGGRLP